MYINNMCIIIHKSVLTITLTHCRKINLPAICSYFYFRIILIMYLQQYQPSIIACKFFLKTQWLINIVGSIKVVIVVIVIGTYI